MVNAFIVRHPRGLILVDTGIGEGVHELDVAYQPVRHALAAALGEVGLHRTDVMDVVNTHLHFDHCGQNRLFQRVPIHVQRAEYEAALRPDYTVPEWVDFPGASYHLLEGDAEIADGVHILSTPGHTPGHQSVLVETASGPVVIAGHAIFSKAEYEDSAPPQAPTPVSVRSAGRIRAVGPRRVFFSHDDEVWERPVG